MKLRYRKGLKFSANFKYRYENIESPFISGRGLLEARAREALTIPIPGFPFIFYHEREDFRYQDITTLPTVKHDIEWGTSWRPSYKVGINLGIKARLYSNNDLGDLDVEQKSLQPSLSVNFAPSSKVSLTTGYSYTQQDSRGPVAIALFDG